MVTAARGSDAVTGGAAAPGRPRSASSTFPGAGPGIQQWPGLQPGFHSGTTAVVTYQSNLCRLPFGSPEGVVSLTDRFSDHPTVISDLPFRGSIHNCLQSNFYAIFFIP